jgi:glycosyltransferase involved in cell wall biosynthesis
MRILLCSVPFAPSVGGIETVSALLAREFVALGHDVTIVTQTPGSAADDDDLHVLRRPAAHRLLRAVRRADVVFHNNVSLRLAWPLVLAGRPWVVAHHVWIPTQGRSGAAGRAKRGVLRYASNVAVSRAVAAALPVPATLIPNPYDDRVFAPRPAIARDRDLVFLGRLVADKGLDVLLRALARLRALGRQPTLTVIGAGPEHAALRELAREHALESQVRFAGALRGEALVQLLNAHRVQVVPSTWEEPFGVVALEGLACGLLPVVTASGGLPEAVGACGLVVPKGDSDALAAALVAALDDRELGQRLAGATREHLARHAPRTVALAYLDVLRAAAADGAALPVGPAGLR